MALMLGCAATASGAFLLALSPVQSLRTMPATEKI
jgi:hypothetical protein